MNFAIPEERRIKMLEIIRRDKIVTVAKMSKEFHISLLTVRRDFEELQKESLIKKVHGGAVSAGRIIKSPVFSEQLSVNIQEKKKIAREAIKRIDDGDFIIIESGTTCQELAKLLYQKRGLRVVTAAPNIIYELMRICREYNLHFQIIVSGGILQVDSNFFIGPHAKKLFEELKADKAFLTTTAVDIENGLSTADPLEAEITKLIIKNSRFKIGLIDHTKFGTSSLVQVAPITELNEIITGKELSESIVEEIRKLKINVTLC